MDRGILVLAVLLAVFVATTGYLAYRLSLVKPGQTTQQHFARIASLDPACTQILFSLGAGGQVVVMDVYSKELLTSLGLAIPSNITILNSIWPAPPVETVVNASPSIICYDIGWYGTSSLGAFSSIGIPLILINGTADRNFDQVIHDVYVVASAIGMRQKGYAVASWINKTIDYILSKVSGQGKPTVVFIGWANPIYSPSNITFIGYEIYVAGGIDIVNTTEPWPTITPSQLIAMDPDYIIATDFMGNCSSTLSAIMQIPGVNMTKAAEDGHIYVLGDLATSLVEEPGPLSVYGAEVLAMILHPGAFGLGQIPRCISDEWVLSNVKPTLPS